MGSIITPTSPLEIKGSFPAEHDGTISAIRPHPLGVKPSGNALTASRSLRTATGTFNILPDDTLLLLLEWLDAPSLLALGATCRALYAFTSSEEIWRTLFVAEPPANFSWRGLWKSSYLGLNASQRPEVDCSCLFSDTLFRPYQNSQISLEPYENGIPRQNQISRMPNLSQAEFNDHWTNIPFILTDVVPKWPVYQDWSEEALLKKYGDKVFRAEAVDWPLCTYIDYMNTTSDESPLYLFDRDFVREMDLKVGPDGSYWPPDCFGEDLFMLLGKQRPDHRWLIVGPKRSGSTFHKDPNATSAWNAVIKGSKYWIMFPPSCLPPGVYMSADQSEVTSPLSVAEWLLAFHEQARHTPGCIEGICGEGEVLHVPSGWWHLVVNLEPAVAITQNFIPRAHLNSALKFLKDKADQVSGFGKEISDPYTLFLDRLRENQPGVLEALEASTSKKRRWEEVVQDSPENQDGAAGGFSFGFGGDDDDIEDEAL